MWRAGALWQIEDIPRYLDACMPKRVDTSGHAMAREPPGTLWWERD
jgi:hypothetical protein